MSDEDTVTLSLTRDELLWLASAARFKTAHDQKRSGKLGEKYGDELDPEVKARHELRAQVAVSARAKLKAAEKEHLEPGQHVITRRQ